MTPERSARARRDTGFTLIELLVVIIIIGILASIAVPIFMNQRKKGVDGALRADLRGVAEQMETYFAENLTYPLSVGNATKTAAFPVGSETAVVTTGNNVFIVFGTGAEAGNYAVCAWNPNGTATSSSQSWVYNSARGGFVSAVEGCPPANDLHTPQ